MPDTQEIRNIRRRLERWELAHLRALAASLDAQLDAATARAEAAEASAAMWCHNTDVLQEELLNLASESGAAIGLTQEGHVVAIKPSEATPLPAIGQHLPDLQGSYAGIAGDVEGGAPGHLIVLDDAPDKLLDWEAAKKWAKSLGDGSRLPTKAEAPLLFANVKDKFVAEWHWTGTQYSSDDAWCQVFYDGFQYDRDKSVKARARAVRRLPLQYFNYLD